jgi:protein-tyrosine phosphatase
MHPYAAEVLTERSVAVGNWTSHRLTRAGVERADLVLTAETAHRRSVVLREPRAMRRTFPLLQFARFASGMPVLDEADPASLGTQLVDGAIAARGSVQSVLARQDDLADPIGKPLRDFRDCALTIDQAIEQILRPLAER